MNKVKIKVLCSSYRFVNYLINNNIFYDSLETNDNYYLLNVSYLDYKKISRRYKTNIIKYYGKIGFILFIKYHKYMIISFVISMVFLYLLSNTIFDIRVNSDNKNIVNIIKSELKDNGIYKNKKKKSFEELSIIKEKILNNNKNTLEWLEIKSKGCIYIIEVTPRVINEHEVSNYKYSSIYASSDGVIKHINVINGTRMVDVNDYVHKGDVLISGNIFKNEKVVRRVNARGSVYAEVWYIVKTSVPFDYYEYTPSGKVINHYYLEMFGKKFTLIGKYESGNTVNKKKIIIDKPYLFFKLYKEVKTEYKNKKHSLNKEEAYNKALKSSEEKIKSNLSNHEYIISKKVLKKELNYSKINIELLGERDGESNKRSN